MPLSHPTSFVPSPDYHLALSSPCSCSGFALSDDIPAAQKMAHFPRACTPQTYPCPSKLSMKLPIWRNQSDLLIEPKNHRFPGAIPWP